MKPIPASSADKDEILSLYRSQLGRECCAWDEDYPGEREIDFDISRDSLYVMKSDTGKIIAAVSIDDDKEVDRLECWSKEHAPGGELARLAVAPEYQNRGIAKAMLSFGMEELYRRGFKSVHFLVNKYNEKAIRSYNHFSFAIVGETTLFNQPFWCYEKPLQPQNDISPAVRSNTAVRIIDNELRLIPYYRNDAVTLPWYQDPIICKQTDNRDTPYDLELLHSMYDYLCENGDCFYIEYMGILVGDITLRNNSELSVVICREYQNRHIGRKCILELLKLAFEKGMPSVKANIYTFNEQSRRAFLAVGFEKTAEEWFEKKLD